MQLVKAPPGSRLCGQACVAMLADVTLAEVITSFGADSTTRAQVVEMLRGYGCRCRGRLSRWRRGFMPPENALLHAAPRYPRHGQSHWLVWDAGRRRVLDPGGGVVRGVSDPLPCEYRITSYMLVTR